MSGPTKNPCTFCGRPWDVCLTLEACHEELIRQRDRAMHALRNTRMMIEPIAKCQMGDRCRQCQSWAASALEYIARAIGGA